ncbi:MAG TPA: phosphotransferase [Dehalococcoidia bacterium]|nr:phosphotransferase [Dehalococcoidia bacterium]
MSEPHLHTASDPDFADLDAVADVLEQLAPTAGSIAPLKRLGSGFFSTAVETASGVVFRLGLAPGVELRHAMEARVLPWLKDLLPLPIPSPEWHVRPCEALPFGALGYRRLPGLPLDQGVLTMVDHDAVAEQLGSFMFALEQISPAEAEARGVPGPGSKVEGLHQTRDESLPIMRSLLGAEGYRQVVVFWEDFLTDTRMRDFEPVLSHSDLGDNNILVDIDESRVTGVLDWEWMAVADPMLNLRGFYRDPSPSFHTKVFAAYESAGGRLDQGVYYRLKRDRQVSTFYGILFAARRRDRAALEMLIGRLRERGVLTGEDA